MQTRLSSHLRDGTRIGDHNYPGIYPLPLDAGLTRINNASEHAVNQANLFI